MAKRKHGSVPFAAPTKSLCQSNPYTSDFRPYPDKSSILSPSFFNITYYTLQASGVIFWGGTEVLLDPSPSYPLYAILNACDLLAKSFYSAVATNIGRTYGPNILTDESVLQTVTSNHIEIAKTFRRVAAGPALLYVEYYTISNILTLLILLSLLTLVN